jgi:hypothetical protein
MGIIKWKRGDRERISSDGELGPQSLPLEEHDVSDGVPHKPGAIQVMNTI